MDPFAKALFDDLEDCRFRDPVGVVQTLRDAGVDKDNVTSLSSAELRVMFPVCGTYHTMEMYIEERLKAQVRKLLVYTD